MIAQAKKMKEAWKAAHPSTTTRERTPTSAAIMVIRQVKKKLILWSPQ